MVKLVRGAATFTLEGASCQGKERQPGGGRMAQKG